MPGPTLPQVMQVPPPELLRFPVIDDTRTKSPSSLKINYANAVT